jgi:RNA polymerase sigma-70 factor (ECF subfamily)
MARAPEPPDFPASQLFLRRLAFHLVRDSARAEDLVQETWAAWVERAPSGVQEPRAWLARVLRNRAFNQKREDARRARRERLAGSPDPSAPATAGTLEAQAELLAALRRLEEPYRTTLVERYYHDLSPR